MCSNSVSGFYYRIFLSLDPGSHTCQFLIFRHCFLWDLVRRFSSASCLLFSLSNSWLWTRTFCWDTDGLSQLTFLWKLRHLDTSPNFWTVHFNRTLPFWLKQCIVYLWQTAGKLCRPILLMTLLCHLWYFLMCKTVFQRRISNFVGV